MGQRKPYNPNTAYGRRKLREQAEINYQNATPEEKAQIDSDRGIMWMIVVVILIIIIVIGFATGNGDSTMKWLSR